MALINCYECGNQISDAAVSCPNCGAPVQSTAQPHQPVAESTGLQCPFCMNEVHEKALTCGNCGAEYGYYDGRRVYSGTWTVIIFGLMLPIVLTILAMSWNEMIGLIVGVIMLIVFLRALWQLIRGKRWWKHR